MVKAQQSKLIQNNTLIIITIINLKKGINKSVNKQIIKRKLIAIATHLGYADRNRTREREKKLGEEKKLEGGSHGRSWIAKGGAASRSWWCAGGGQRSFPLSLGFSLSGSFLSLPCLLLLLFYIFFLILFVPPFLCSNLLPLLLFSSILGY